MSEENKNPEAAPEQAQEAAELTISDLNALKTIIDVASSRGCFKPNEMVVVGQTYNKLAGFLSQVAAQQPQSEPGV